MADEMADEAAPEPAQRSRIEGGVDAVVLGGGPDALIAAAYLGRAKLKTVLLADGAELGAPHALQTFAGLDVAAGEHLLHALEPRIIDDLDLYRAGVSFAARRLDSVYFFGGDDSLNVEGDLRAAGARLDDDHPGADWFFGGAFEAAAQLREALEARKPTSVPQTLLEMAAASAQDRIAAALPPGALQTAMLAEAAFRNASPPHEAMSFGPLIARWSGEIAGFQGGVGYPAGGVGAVVDAMRRVAQRARVDIRAASRVEAILIERDQAAGVALEDGGQLRAPIVISALSAEQTFSELIGAEALDLRFQSMLGAPRANITSAHLYLAVDGAPLDEATREALRKRMVFAPGEDALRKAFAAAARGEIPEDGVLEIICPTALDAGGSAGDAPAHGAYVLSVIAHPVPLIDEASEEARAQIRDRIIASLDKVAPGLSDRIKEERLFLADDLAAMVRSPASAFGARAGLARQIALRDAAQSASAVSGLYFCGPEAQIGYGLSGAAGRRAALAALHRAVRPGAAP